MDREKSKYFLSFEILKKNPHLKSLKTVALYFFSFLISFLTSISPVWPLITNTHVLQNLYNNIHFHPIRWIRFENLQTNDKFIEIHLYVSSLCSSTFLLAPMTLQKTNCISHSCSFEIAMREFVLSMRLWIWIEIPTWNCGAHANHGTWVRINQYRFVITILSDGKLASANVSLTCVALDFIETFHIIEYVPHLPFGASS